MTLFSFFLSLSVIPVNVHSFPDRISGCFFLSSPTLSPVIPDPRSSQGQAPIGDPVSLSVADEKEKTLD